YWLQHGGLAEQGYPLTEEYREGSKLDGKPYTVQYFERGIFELHPDNAAPYNVLLAQLGTFRYRQKHPHGAAGQHRNPTAARDFAQTGHGIGGSFRRYWEQHGGLAQFGYPLTDEFAEKSDLNGQTYTVQYFERAVFEAHPENAPPYDVLLSQLGKYELNARYRLGQNPAMARVTPPVPPAATQTPGPTRVSASCRNAPGDTLLCLDSEAGDYIGQGARTVFTADDAGFEAYYDGTLRIIVHSADYWTLTFAPPQGSRLAPGRYDHVEDYAVQSPRRPGMRVSGGGRGCEGRDGRFEILELAYDSATGTVSKLAVNFEQHCGSGGPALLGSIRIHSNAGRTGPPPPQPPTPTPAPPRASATCWNTPGDTFLCLDSQAGDHIGTGHTTILTSNDASFSATYSDGVSVSAQGSDDWLVEFVPPAGQALTVGVYDRAEGAPFLSPRRPGLDISGAGRACNRLTGRFEILDLAYDRTTGVVTRFAAHFEQQCEGDTAPLICTVRIHSTAGRSGPPPPVPPPPTGFPPRLAPACAGVTGVTTYLCLSSEAGDYIGQGGQDWVYTAPATQFTGGLSHDGGVTFFVKQGAADWELTFAPPQGRQLTPGRYDQAEWAVFHAPLRPGLEISGMSRICQSLTGRFEILEFRYDYATGAVRRFRANFEQHCDGNAPALLGTIRFDATASP
ncbi:MAG TPA: hypothetical protein VFM49_17615, partial [Chloroflexia bacterium]|nr:hypothetical protein [Chloroflexia bacterium]